jgi:predicted CxxxxCH...CXXCH cytochrome family protein
MSQITWRALLFALFVSAVLFAGCSDPNSRAYFDPDTGRHITGWYPSGHKAAAATDLTGCTECHGDDFLGGISKVSCRTCHINQTPGSFSCSECHPTPPSAPAHPVHDFPNVSCFSCHLSTVGTALHNNGSPDIVMNPAYTAKTGGALTYNSGTATCSNVSCHGGQTAPDWTSGTIDVNTDPGCALCHAFGTAQYNSYNSGEHDRHVNNEGVGCTGCHDTTRLAVNHFSRLDTTAMEGPSSATLRLQTEYNGSSCNPEAGGLSGCHGNESWN